MRTYLLVGDVHEFRDVCFVKRMVHVRQIFVGENLEDVAVTSAGEPLIVAKRPADEHDTKGIKLNVHMNSRKMCRKRFIPWLFCI